ncbi:hypothetical protein ABVF61_19170 [Roseibium sp. HPY-6]|uniref:hypothetical protein n=1 Tax=Roseibium sp. HPY-6 TaxID=3229852 RepID=UPI00339002CF
MPLDDQNPASPEFKKSAQEWTAKQTPDKWQVKEQDYGFEKDNYPNITTQAEMENLQKSREAPKFAEEYTIGGTIQNKVHSDLSEQNEQRIEYLHDSLEAAAKEFEDSFEKSAFEGFSRNDNEPEL